MKALLALLFVFHLHSKVSGDYTELCRLFKNGTKLREPGTCSQYIECNGRSGQLLACDDTQLFDRNKGSCVDAKSLASDTYCGNRCEVKGNDGKWITDPTNCHGYLYCNGGVPQQGYCPNGHHFDEAAQMCAFDTNSGCVEVANICDIAPDKTKFTDEKLCNSYYECTSSKLSAKTCAKDKYFDVETGNCIDKTLVTTCRAHPLPADVCGKESSPKPGYKTDAATCRGFFYCTDLGIVSDLLPSWGQCSEGLFFNSTLQTCAFPKDVICTYNRCESRGTMQVASSSNNCHNYIICKDGLQIEERTCSNDFFFDEDLQACVPYLIYDNCCDGRK